MAGQAPPRVTVEEADIFWLNFEGREGLYNQEGERSFHTRLDPDIAQQMLADGWNCKLREPNAEKEEDFEPYWHVEVAVSYKIRPPQVTLIVNDGQNRQFLTEQMVGMVDNLDIASVDLVLNGSHWHQKATGKSGIKAYLHKMFIVVNEDALDRKYAHVGFAGDAASE